MQNYFVILDTQMSLHKNSFDDQQRRFLYFIFIINLESEKAHMLGLHVHLLFLPCPFFSVRKLEFCVLLCLY